MNPIETPRLILREFCLDDLNRYWEIQRDPEMTRYTADGGVKSIEAIEDAIRNQVLPDYQTHGYGRWAVVHRESNLLIGFAGLKYLTDRSEVDIGYRLSPEYWGQGLATEAASAVMNYGWNVLELSQIIGMVLPENTASVRVLQKLGMEFIQHEYEDGLKIAIYAADSPTQEK